MVGQTFIQYRGKVYGSSNFYSVYRGKVYGCQTSFQYRGKVYGWSNLYSVPRQGLRLVKPLLSTEGRFMIG